MAACNTATIISDAVCVDSCVSDGMRLSVIISLLCKLNGMTTCDPAQLIADAACVDSCVPPGMRLSVIASLLCQLVQGGGTGGSKPQVFCGHYGGLMPTTPIPDPSVSCAMNYDLDPPFITWKWSGTDWGG